MPTLAVVLCVCIGLNVSQRGNCNLCYNVAFVFYDRMLQIDNDKIKFQQKFNYRNVRCFTNYMVLGSTSI